MDKIEKLKKKKKNKKTFKVIRILITIHSFIKKEKIIIKNITNKHLYDLTHKPYLYMSRSDPPPGHFLNEIVEFKPKKIKIENDAFYIFYKEII
jgi:hypothetical protein